MKWRKNIHQNAGKPRFDAQKILPLVMCLMPFKNVKSVPFFHLNSPLFLKKVCAYPCIVAFSSPPVPCLKTLHHASNQL